MNDQTTPRAPMTPQPGEALRRAVMKLTEHPDCLCNGQRSPTVSRGEVLKLIEGLAAPVAGEDVSEDAPLSAEEERDLRDWVANIEPKGTPTETARLLATLDAARLRPDEELLRVALMAFDPEHPRFRDNLATKVAGIIALRRLAANQPVAEERTP